MNLVAEQPLAMRPLINVGALMDIPTGSYFTGPKGEMILNGGMSGIVGLVGRGNNFKSTITHFMTLTSMDRLNASGMNASLSTYDTEDNMAFNIERLNNLATRHKYVEQDPLYNPNVWSIISKSVMDGTKWSDSLYKLVEAKIKDDKKYFTYDAFINRMTGKPIRLPKANFIEIDSFTELEGSTTIDTLDKGNIDSSNTLFMQQGLFKVKILKDLPRLSVSSNTYFVLTAHLGKEINMASGPFAPQPKKALQYIKQDEKIKGVSDKIYFLSTHMWYAHMSSAMINQNTKMPEYPIDEDDVETDLNLVRLTMLRSKTGPSGFTISVVVSQREGVLPTLTEFHYIKTNKFGLDGSVRSYWLYLYPDVKLSRTTVRNKIDENPKLRRAIGITSELLQIKTFMPKYKKIICTPEELYNDIKDMGYDWNEILETRGWWTPSQYKVQPNYLSTLDLLKMRKGLYEPKFLTRKKGKDNEQENKKD